jgi:signal transduction histidine kinase
MTQFADQEQPAVSARVAVALAGARDRRERWSGRLRPALGVVIVTVLIVTLRDQPRPGWTGVHLGVTIALAGCLLPMIWSTQRRWWPINAGTTHAAVLSLTIGASGVTLAALQPVGISALPASVSIMVALFFLPPRQAIVIAAAVGAGLATAMLASGSAVLNALTNVLFCAVLGVMAVCMSQAGRNSDRAELLLAQLEDARAAEAQAVALAERTRIAQDLHDVLAHSLSGLAIQTEAARRLARRGQSGEDLTELLDRCAKLAKEGLTDARRAVGALRGDAVATLDRLPELVERYRGDLELDATLTVSGARRELPGEAGLALYRGAQEALTNAVRYARGSQTLVTLSYEQHATVLTIEDRRTEVAAVDLAGAHSATAPEPAPVVFGSGLGLVGMRERLAEVGGTATAGPTQEGWIVRMEIPA